ncbi:MAG: hypothetical protein HP498_01875 [Nitrospira sp.]|jgi:hypothetical protein|nr:hypothetical protein [Nitrospira sp.]
MNSTRHDDKADKIPQSGGADKPTHDAKDLTCNEAQVEELLSEGESTEDEAEEQP